MFSSITDYKSKSYYEKHKNMYLITPTANYRLEVFSAYVTPADSDTYMRGFGENEEYEQYISKIREVYKKGHFYVKNKIQKSFA